MRFGERKRERKVREGELRTLSSNLEEIVLELWMRSSKRTHHFFQRAHQDTPRNRDVFPCATRRTFGLAAASGSIFCAFFILTDERVLPPLAMTGAAEARVPRSSHSIVSRFSTRSSPSSYSTRRALPLHPRVAALPLLPPTTTPFRQSFLRRPWRTRIFFHCGLARSCDTRAIRCSSTTSDRFRFSPRTVAAAQAASAEPSIFRSRNKKNHLLILRGTQ